MQAAFDQPSGPHFVMVPPRDQYRVHWIAGGGLFSPANEYHGWPIHLPGRVTGQYLYARFALAILNHVPRAAKTTLKTVKVPLQLQAAVDSRKRARKAKRRAPSTTSLNSHLRGNRDPEAQGVDASKTYSTDVSEASATSSATSLTPKAESWDDFLRRVLVADAEGEGLSFCTLHGLIRPTTLTRIVGDDEIMSISTDEIHERWDEGQAGFSRYFRLKLDWQSEPSAGHLRFDSNRQLFNVVHEGEGQSEAIPLGVEEHAEVDEETSEASSAEMREAT
jgi:hypothetical protein